MAFLLYIAFVMMAPLDVYKQTINGARKKINVHIYLCLCTIIFRILSVYA